MTRLPTCVVLACLTFTGVAGAEPITYSEALHGDLGQLSSPPDAATPTVFSLDVGLNTFTGTLSQGPGSSDADFDSIAFSVPVGAQLTTVSYSIRTTFVGGAEAGGLVFLLTPSSLLTGTSLAELRIVSFVGEELHEGTAFANALPLGSGSYGIAHVGFSFDGPFGGAVLQNYQWTLGVEPGTPPPPVPEPATWLLLASGAAAVVRRGRRQAGAQERQG